MGSLQDSRAVEPLLQILKDKKKIVRKTAAWALGNIADERAVPGLTDALLDEDDEVRNAARKALDTIKNKGAAKHANVSPKK